MKKYLLLAMLILTISWAFSQDNIILPSNPNSTQEARCVLNYLYNLNKNPTKKIISGQMINMGINHETAYQNDIVGLYNKTNKWVGLVGSNYQRNPNGFAQNTHETNIRIIEHFKKGGLVTMFCSFSNPWTNKGFNDTTGRYRIMDLIDTSKPVHKEWLKRLDSVAVGIRELQDSGVVVLYRFFPENNGSWFWWGVQTATFPTQSDWKKLWIHAHDYFSKVKKLNNILWVFAPSAKESLNRNPLFKPDMYYYPGNEYVDIVGTAVYNDTLDIPYYNELKNTGKPIALTEFGPGMITRDTTNYDYTILINKIRTKFPDFVYWLSWNDFSSNGGRDTVYYSPLHHQKGKELLQDSWVANRGEIDWQKNCSKKEEYPAQLSNSNSTEKTKCIYKYLTELPKKSDHKIISGQMTNAFLLPDEGYKAMIENLHTKTGKWVGIVGTDYVRSWPSKITQINEANQVLIDHFKKGGLAEIKWSTSNPWTGRNMNDTNKNRQIADLVKTGTAANQVLIKMMDSIAIGLKSLQDSGVTVLWRPFCEMNAPWFWWGSASETTNGAEDFKNLWKYVFTYLSNTKNLNNLIWVYAPSVKSTGTYNPIFKDEMYYYPGDAYTDIIGVDVYSDTLDIPNYSTIKSRNKPIALCEFGPSKASSVNLPRTYDYTKMLNQVKSKYPDFVYWLSWNDFSTGGGKDTTYYGMANQLKVTELMNDSYVLTRDDFDWDNYCKPEIKNRALLEPEDGKVYHGACLMTYENNPDPIGPYLGALNDKSIQPAVRGLFMSIPGERGPDKSLIALKNFFHASDSIGFIPELSLFFIGKTASDSAIAVSTQYDWIIDSVITLSKNYGRKMFLRLGGEFNGSGPGWNGGGYHPYLYVTAFRKIVDKFAARGLRDSIAVNWCYEPDAANDFDSVDTRGARWYPGDTYVDWFGLDVFDAAHFDQSLPDGTGRNITKKGKSERFLAMARAKGKPVFMSETSAKSVNISADNQDGIDDWNNWFAKFFEFINVHKEIKGYNYINANWPSGAYPNWGDARIQNSTYVTAKYKEEMKKTKYIHLPFNINQNGPWNSPLKIAVSTDGINFNSEMIFQDSAGVPSVIKWKGDTLACVFQWFRQPINSSTWDRVAVKFSYNNGLTWTEPVPIVVNGIPANYQRPFDPTLSVLPNNKLRIYYSSSNGMPKGLDTAINTYSAISDNGIDYTFESGARYDNNQTKLIDPAVIYFNNEWHYISPAGAPQDGAYHCTSTNGLDFTEKAKITSDNTHNWTGKYMVESSTELRFYGSGPNIWYNNSSDGFVWNNYTNTNVKGGDPSVVKLAENQYLMIFVGQPKNIQNPPGKPILISPLNNSNTKSINQDLVWHKIMPDINQYHLQVSFSNRFLNFDCNDSTLTETTYNFFWVLQDTAYYWRVRGKNSIGWGEWSDVWTFMLKTIFAVGDDPNLTEMITLNPNPATDYIEISVGANGRSPLQSDVRIYDVFGQIVSTVNPTPTLPASREGVRIDVSGLAPGMYFVRISDRVGKFVKL